MISGKQLKQVLDYSFTSGSTFVSPSATFLADFSSYTTLNIPASISLTGTITPNDGTNIQWVIINSSGTVLGSGLGNNALVTLSGVNIPSTLGVNTYTLTVTYLDLTGASASQVFLCTVTVSSSALIGQINNASQNIILPSDLTPYESSLTDVDQAFLINLFPINALNTGRLVIVVPINYGAVVSITDNTNQIVTNQFNAVLDAPNSRIIYVTDLVITPGSYYYKVNF